MPLVIPATHCHVQHRFTGTALPFGAATTYGAVKGAVAPVADAQFFHEAFDQYLMDYLSSGLTLIETLVKWGPNDTGPFAVWGAAVPGRASATTITPNVAYLINKSTALGGKANRGRMYLPGAPEQDLNPDGTLGAGVAAAVNPDLMLWHADLAGNGTEMVVLHNGPSAPTPVTFLNLNPRAATQRRRLRR